MVSKRGSVALVIVAVASLGAPMVSTTTSVASGATSVPHCQYHQLRVTEGRGGAGLGHEGMPIRFKNRSSTTCSIRAYPGAAGLNKHGKQVEQARRTKNGYLGGVESGHKIPTVVLKPGRTASALIEGTDVPMGNKKHCKVLHGLLVTPPNDQKSVHLKHAPPDCSGLEIHPVVKGKKGGEGK